MARSKRHAVITIALTVLFLGSAFTVPSPADAADADATQPCPDDYKLQSLGGKTACVKYVANGETCLGGKQPQVENLPSGQVYACYVEPTLPKATDVTCVGSFQNIFFPKCWARTLSVIIGTALITLTAWLLATVAMLFNFLIDHTIIQFGLLFTKGVREAIEVGWTGIRDIANIVIIGMFVFYAINIILGVREFSEKKNIAKILVIAVLLNFSLLFTKGIIDASNFTATQFYIASGLRTDAQAQTLSGAFSSTFTQVGIAGSFIKFMGLTTVGDTYQSLSTAAFGTESKKYADANGWYALLHGLVAATLLGIAAFVFLYGCFLLITRAVMLILLMLTSALAFASWLIPSAKISQGWDKWWEALLKSAFLAPILMALLWATMMIAEEVAKRTPTGTLGALVKDPSTPLNLEALLSYVIVVGLLLASFMATRALTNSIAGYGNIASVVRGVMFGLPLAATGLASRFVLAPLARQTIGRNAYWTREGLIGAGEALRTRAGELRILALDDEKYGLIKSAEAKRRKASRLEKKAGEHALWAGRADTLASAGFNVADTAGFRALGKVLGVAGSVSGERDKDAERGFRQGVEAKIKLGQERARALEVSPSERQKTLEEERARVARERGESTERADLRRGHDLAKAERDAARAAEAADEGGHIAGARGELTRIRAEAQRQKQAIETITQRDVGNLRTQLARATTDAEKNRLLEQIENRTRQGQREMALHDADVSRTQGRLDELLRPLREAGEKLERASDALSTYDKETDRRGREGGTLKVQAKQLGATGAANVIGRRSAGLFYRATGLGEHIGNEVSGKIRGRRGAGQLRAALSQYREEAPDAFRET